MNNKIKSANPAPLGLLGFGMTTILLNLHNLGVTELTAVIAAMGLALGGMCQIIAGLVEYKKGNTFGATAFTAYGFFWISLVLIWENDFSDKVLSADKVSMGFYLLLWGLFTSAMFVGTLKHNITSKIIFGTLAILFFTLSLGDFLDNETITKVAGVIGIICGSSALYSAFGQIINEEFDKKVLPL